MKTIWLAMLAACVGVGLSVSLSMAQGEKQEESALGFKQVRLTDKDMQGFISAQRQLAPIVNKIEASGNKVDPEVQKQVEQIAKSSGFSTIDELGTVTANVSLVLAGLDLKTGQFTEPPDLIRKEIAAVEQNQALSQEDKSQALGEMHEALKTAPPLQFKENVAVVKKYQKEIDQVLAPAPGKQQEPADNKPQGPAGK
jgi:hypothetical protein